MKPSAQPTEAKSADFYSYKAVSIEGDTIDFATYKGKVVLVVNTASKCGFTGQYKDLQALHDKYKDSGLVVLGFPCNQFAGQEPGSADEIKSFCSLNYGVSFQMLGKIDVKGKNIHPIYEYLTTNAFTEKQDNISWNFTKFIIDKNGKITGRFSPQKNPSSLEVEIKKLL